MYFDLPVYVRCREELVTSEKTKTELGEKLKELEKQVNKLQHELNNVASGNTSRKSDDDVRIVFNFVTFLTQHSVLIVVLL